MVVLLTGTAQSKLVLTSLGIIMVKSQKTVVEPSGNKSVWYILEHESGKCAMSKTKNYRRLKKILLEEVKKS